MSPLVQDVSLAANLRRIGRLVASLPGEPLDAFGALRLTGAHGRAVPIYWCFNDAHEFAALSQAFGDSQPFVGMRSLNQVMEFSPATMHAYDEIAGHYADRLMRRFGPSPCIVGGNCQAAAISYRVAVKLLQGGAQVLRLVTVDAEPRYPFPGPVRLLFGRESRHNPFIGTRVGAVPQRAWRMAYGKAEWRIVEGQHGGYFAPRNIRSLARAIREPSQGAIPDRRPLDIDWTVTQRGDEMLVIEAPAPRGMESKADLAILPVWRRSDGSLSRIDRDDWVVSISPGPHWTCALPLPAAEGPWTMTPALCRLDHGPQTWPPEGDSSLNIA